MFKLRRIRYIAYITIESYNYAYLRRIRYVPCVLFTVCICRLQKARTTKFDINLYCGEFNLLFISLTAAYIIFTLYTIEKLELQYLRRIRHVACFLFTESQNYKIRYKLKLRRIWIFCSCHIYSIH